jgi:hypothetical protein
VGKLDWVEIAVQRKRRQRMSEEKVSQERRNWAFPIE